MQIRVHVRPGARKERFEEIRSGEFDVQVKEKPERNEANTRVQRLLAEHFNVPLTSIRFITGTRGRNKLFEVVR